MGAVLSPKAWEDNSQAKLDYLESLVGKAVQEKMEAKDSLIESLTSERDTLLGKVSQFEALESAIRAETDAKIKAVKAEADAKVQAANKAHADGSSRQRGVYESRLSDTELELSKTQGKLKKSEEENEQLKSDNIRLKNEIKNNEIKLDLLEQMNAKLDQIIEMVQNLAESGAAPEKIVEVIQDVKNERTRIEKIKALIDLEAQGFTSAKDLIPRLEHLGVKHASRISELRKSKEYKDMKGGDKHVET